MKNLILILLSLMTFACSKDGNTSYNCENVESKGEIILNEENYRLQTSGRGIDLREDGYEVTLFYAFYSESNSIDVSIKFPYKNTGKNVIKKVNFLFTVAEDFQYYEEELISENFESEVFANTNYCFEGEFSASFQIGDKTFRIDKAILSYKYEEPLNPVTIE